MDFQRCAGRQAGAISSAQLAAHGVSPFLRRRYVQAGTLEAVGDHLYRLSSWPPSRHQEIWLALLAAGAGAVAFRRCAAALWRMDGSRPDVVEVAVPRPRQSSVRGVPRLLLAPVDVTAVDGIPVTAAARTLLDLARVEEKDLVERGVEYSLRKKLVTLKQLDDMVASPGGKGVRPLREVLARRPRGAPPTESDAETLFVQLVRSSGLAAPDRQVELLLGGRRIRVDFAWPLLRLAVEIDGAATHATRDAFGADLRRQNLLVNDGWRVLRFTWEDVALYPSQVRACLLEAWRHGRVVAFRG